MYKPSDSRINNRPLFLCHASRVSFRRAARGFMRSHYVGAPRRVFVLFKLHGNFLLPSYYCVTFYILHANAVNLWSAAIGYWFRAKPLYGNSSRHGETLLIFAVNAITILIFVWDLKKSLQCQPLMIFNSCFFTHWTFFWHAMSFKQNNGKKYSFYLISSFHRVLLTLKKYKEFFFTAEIFMIFPP